MHTHHTAQLYRLTLWLLEQLLDLLQTAKRWCQMPELCKSQPLPLLLVLPNTPGLARLLTTQTQFAMSEQHTRCISWGSAINRLKRSTQRGDRNNSIQTSAVELTVSAHTPMSDRYCSAACASILHTLISATNSVTPDSLFQTLNACGCTAQTRRARILLSCAGTFLHCSGCMVWVN